MLSTAYNTEWQVCRNNAWPMQALWSGTVVSNKLGGTKITISKLLPEVLQTLRDPVKIAELRSHIASMYHFHLVRAISFQLYLYVLTLLPLRWLA